MAIGPSVLLVGCGNMGGALLAGWRDRGIEPARITVIEPDRARATAVSRQFGVVAHTDFREIATRPAPDVVLLAVKPQFLAAIAPAYANLAGAGTLFLSIAAGRTLAFLERHLGPGAAIVRAMPNTPAAVQAGITVCCANDRVSACGRAQASELLAAVGRVLWVEDEALLDPVTAVSGSGPAYVFLLAECLAEAGRVAGLPADVAAILARTTVTGAGELLRRSEEPASVLRERVTSPGGTTAAALALLMDPSGLQPLITAAVTAATERSRELAGDAGRPPDTGSARR